MSSIYQLQADAKDNFPYPQFIITGTTLKSQSGQFLILPVLSAILTALKSVKFCLSLTVTCEKI